MQPRRTTMSKHIIPITLFAMAVAGQAYADKDEYRESHGASMPVKNELYQKECGDCHIAYPAELLPARSWEHLMNKLDKHFGENAELSEDNRQALSRYLTENAGDRSRGSPGKLLKSLDRSQTPERITELPYFKKEHREIPARFYEQNPKMKSLSNCEVCHTRAAQGSFAEGEINIPGIGRWED
ncbi:MAG: hypothetical protein A2V90_03015 [Gammaproteobacteria bacterium RBG_16_57_12]|nr:MAG: hypothetical protein A2V90_03015 [Gammaproteobacteria bacterium RBG_16_57_12]